MTKEIGASQSLFCVHYALILLDISGTDVYNVGISFANVWRDDMNINQIKLFVTISECGTYTKAGEIEGYTQSRVTQMMKALEEEVGFSLFSKNRTGVCLTESGAQLLPRMRQIIIDMGKLESEIKEINGLTQGVLRIATHISCSIKWLPPVLKYFRDNYPDVKIDISEGGQTQNLNLLEDRAADIGLITTPLGEEKVDFMPLYTEPLMVVFPRGHKLGKFKKVPVKELSGQSFIIASDDFDSDSARMLRSLNLDVNVDLISRNDFSIMSMVAQNMGIGILPELILECTNNDDIEYRELDPPITRTIGVGAMSIKELGPVEKMFIEVLKNELGVE